MALFGSGRQVSVDSVAYNLAGAEENRPNYLKSLVIGSILASNKNTISESIQRGYSSGPATKFKQFYRWSKRPGNYNEIGLPTGELRRKSVVSSLAVENAYFEIYGTRPWIQRAQVGDADIETWAEQYLLENEPDVIGTQWQSDVLPNGDISILTEDELTFVFTPVNYDRNARYVYAWYNEITSGSITTVSSGTWIAIGTDPFPSVSGWSFEGTSTSGGTTVTTYKRVTYDGVAPGGSRYLHETMSQREIIDGSTIERDYRISSQAHVGVVHGQSKIFIYKIGSGSTALDTLVSPSESFGEFFPFIPVRYDNQFLSETYFAPQYLQAKKAYKKATGSRFDDLIDKVADNPNLGDIDHTFISFGVSLNAVDNSAKRYLYSFFQRLQETQVGGPDLFAAWKAAMIDQEDVFAIWSQWKTAQSDEEDSRFGLPEPTRPVLPQMPGNEIRITGGGSIVSTHFDMRLNWTYIANGTGSGLAKPGAKAGDLWFGISLPDPLLANTYGGGAVDSLTTGASVDSVRLYHQISATSYRYLDLVGLFHTNFVYGNKYVSIPASVAIADTDESGFVVPMHYDVWSDMSLIHQTQMSTACVYIVFNSYKIVKAKWYQKGVFQILIVIAIAVVSVLFTGGAGVGLLGAHMAVGAAFGLTGLAAAIVGSVVNALAAMILSSLLTRFGTGIFGEQFGAIFATLVMAFAGGGIINFETGSLAVNWGDLLKVDNLLSITNALGQVYTGKINQETMRLAQDMIDLKDSAKAESEKIQQAFFKEFGYGGGTIDPMMYVDVASSARILAESSDTFLARTLLTGGDIAGISQDMLSNFVEYSNKLPDAFA